MCRTRSQTLKQLSEELTERGRHGISWSNAELKLSALTQLGSVKIPLPRKTLTLHGIKFPVDITKHIAHPIHAIILVRYRSEVNSAVIKSDSDLHNQDQHTLQFSMTPLHHAGCQSDMRWSDRVGQGTRQESMPCTVDITDHKTFPGCSDTTGQTKDAEETGISKVAKQRPKSWSDRVGKCLRKESTPSDITNHNTFFRWSDKINQSKRREETEITNLANQSHYKRWSDEIGNPQGNARDDISHMINQQHNVRWSDGEDETSREDAAAASNLTNHHPCSDREDQSTVDGKFNMDSLTTYESFTHWSHGNDQTSNDDTTETSYLTNHQHYPFWSDRIEKSSYESRVEVSSLADHLQHHTGDRVLIKNMVSCRNYLSWLDGDDQSTHDGESEITKLNNCH
ncbi:hypothetical protein RRG08_058735 [Elysia crispata]|uniref:Uncharacterized protein n=1 Tax=Elysia crispata TaxID=231223 RepID=A0AAE0YWN6_9GAST|nr:hypothetical protein RRG08_058735 [Elysia crispata]